jgi:large subunit ribosomal protein L21
VQITEILPSGADKSGVKAAMGAGSAPAAVATEAPKKAAPKGRRRRRRTARPRRPRLRTISSSCRASARRWRRSFMAAGVTSFAQIAAWTEADIAAVRRETELQGPDRA